MPKRYSGGTAKMVKNPLLGLLKRCFNRKKFSNAPRKSVKKSGFWTFVDLSVNNKKGMK